MEKLKRSWQKSRKIMEFEELKRVRALKGVRNPLNVAVTKLLSGSLFRSLHPNMFRVLFLVPFYEKRKLAP